MTLDSTMRATAEDLIGQFGKAVTIRRVVKDYSAATGKATVDETDHTTKGVLEDFAERDIDGTVVLRGDTKLHVAAKPLSIAPDRETDEVIFDLTTYRVVNVQAIYSGEQVALFTLHLSR